MLYLPPRYAHDGLAIGECMTYSVGFKAVGLGELAAEMLQRLAQDAADVAGERMYRDPGQNAVDSPGALPAALAAFSRLALQRIQQDPMALPRALGEYLTEPKARVWFDTNSMDRLQGPVRLDRRTRMMYDKNHVFVNGESYRASGRDATLMRRLADTRVLDAGDAARASTQARLMLLDWCQAGWAHGH